MSEQIMTPEQLQDLHDDIRDGISIIVAKDHYHDMEAKVEQLQAELTAKDAALEKIKESSYPVQKVLGDLVDIQNGPPLIRDKEKWNKIMARAYELLDSKGKK